MVGPVQLIAMSLPAGPDAADAVLTEVDRLAAGSAVRLLDVLVVSAGADGTVVESSVGVDEDFGELVARVLPSAGDRDGGGRSPPAGGSLLYLLVEHRWAAGVVTALEGSGGHLLDTALITPQLRLLVDGEVAAMEDAARSVAQAQASEATARLRAIAAWQDADQAVAQAAQIRSAAAAEVVATLNEAGLVRSVAVHDALDALIEAGLIVAAADRSAAGRVRDQATAIAVAQDEASAAQGQAAAAQERAAQAQVAASVTPAELRVLRYLPTTLTFALIADKLGISREAAKSRAGRLYRRLGVHDRASAVGRARELRVLP